LLTSERWISRQFYEKRIEDFCGKRIENLIERERKLLLTISYFGKDDFEIFLWKVLCVC
jgi:hypothetical protein